MRHTDIAIVGAGLAGSTAAAMLGRAGIDAVLIDPRSACPPAFRCEKLDASQIALLRQTGVADVVFSAATLEEEVTVARFGRVVDIRPHRQWNIFYDELVNVVRRVVPPGVEFIQATAAEIAAGPDRQRLTLSNGEEISARLVVLASGPNFGPCRKLGIMREIVSPCHSISIGFNLKPAGRVSFGFHALTYFGENAADRVAYLALFPIGPVLRANLFVYRDLDDPWLKEIRHGPVDALFTPMPNLRGLLGEVEIAAVKIRPVDLYVTHGHRQAGIVLVGDAFATGCPAAGTGCNKVFTDVVRLCQIHIPQWLHSPGMDERKIAAFYDDKVKVACDAASTAKAYYMRSLSTAPGLSWQARRWGRFLGQSGLGAIRDARRRLSAAATGGQKRHPERPIITDTRLQPD